MWTTIGAKQDCGTCHTNNETNNLLKETLDKRITSCCGPPRSSCDLTPLGIFLCGYVES